MASKTLASQDSQNRNLIVQKSRPLLALWRTPFTLPEFKLLDVYLAKINSTDPTHRTVLISKSDLEAALGVTKLNKADMDKRLKRLNTMVDLAQGDSKKIHQIALFEEAVAEQDDNGAWQISLTCTDKAMQYIFNIEKIGYLRYKLQSVTQLTSRYSYILFCYLEDNRFRGTWTVELSKLRHMLSCDTDKSYDNFKVFNQGILKRCWKEIHEKTRCEFTYTPNREKRRVTSITFTVAALPNQTAPTIDADAVHIMDGGVQENDEDEILEEMDTRAASRERINAGFSDEIFAEFTEEELTLLREKAWTKVDDADVAHHKKVLNDALLARQWACSDYLRKKIMQMNCRKNVKYRFAYLQRIIEKDD